jgi:toxin YoeB
MPKIWDDSAWYDYIDWQTEDKKTLKRINELIKDIERNGAAVGIGKPEKLKYRDEWSRRIDHANRLIYSVDKDGNLLIIACKGHYED